MDSFDAFKHVTESNIGDMAEAFAKQNAAEGKIIFVHGCTKKLKGLMHWIQDKHRCNGAIDHAEFTLAAMEEALGRAAARKVESDQNETTAKAAMPEKFKKEVDWSSFEQALVNYLSCIPGVNGVPLSYNVSTVDLLEDNAVYHTFIDWAVAHMPWKAATSWPI